MSQQSTTQAWARGGALFAATVMLIAGIFQIFEGLAGILRHAFYVASPHYVYTVGISTWGWIHLGIGIVVALTGLSLLMTGSAWSRVVGIGVASLSMIANFFFVPYYPLWALLIIAIDVFVIWSLATVNTRREMYRAATAPQGYDSSYGMSTHRQAEVAGDAVIPEQRPAATPSDPTTTLDPDYGPQPPREAQR